MACLAEVVRWLNELLTSVGRNVLLAAGLGCEGCVATVALAALMLSKQKTLYEVLVNPAHSNCALQVSCGSPGVGCGSPGSHECLDPVGLLIPVLSPTAK